MSDPTGTTRRGFLSLRFGQPKSKPTSEAMRARPAMILEHACIAYQGSFCSVCREHCPEPGAIVVAQGKPKIDPVRCTGCGQCAEVCPAPFGGAIAVMPRSSPRR